MKRTTMKTYIDINKSVVKDEYGVKRHFPVVVYSCLHSVISEYVWYIYPYSSGLLHWYWYGCPSSAAVTVEI